MPKKTGLYDTFLAEKTQLTTDEATTIINNLNSHDGLSISNILKQTGALALNSLPPQTPWTKSTTNFNLYTVQLPQNKPPPQINQANLQVNFPRFSTVNTSLSVITWHANPYINITNATLTPDTKVISITLSNFTGSALVSTYLSEPVQIQWATNQTANQTNQTATCMYWNTTMLNWDNYGCYLVNKTNTTITCNCTHLTDFAARFTAVAQSNQVIFQSISSVYSAEGVKTYMNFYIIFGSIGAIGLLTFITGIYLDAEDSKTYYRLILLNPIVQKIAKKYIVDVCCINRVEPLNNANEADPTPENKPSLLYIIINRILFQHSQLSAFIRYDPRLSRLFCFMLIFVGLFNSLFLTAFMYGFTYGSDETAVASMSIAESLILSLITAALNYPSLILLSRLINSAGLAEFAWRYPVILDELIRRHRFENEISMYDEDALN